MEIKYNLMLALLVNALEEGDIKKDDLTLEILEKFKRLVE